MNFSVFSTSPWVLNLRNQRHTQDLFSGELQGSPQREGGVIYLGHNSVKERRICLTFRGLEPPNTPGCATGQNIEVENLCFFAF